MFDHIILLKRNILIIYKIRKKLFLYTTSLPKTNGIKLQIQKVKVVLY